MQQNQPYYMNQGQPQQPGQPYQLQEGSGAPGGYQVRPTNGIATAGMVVGIIGLVLFLVPVLGFLLGITGLILSIIGYKKAKRVQVNKGMAVTGLVTSPLAIVANGAWTAVVVVGMMWGIGLITKMGDAGSDMKELAQSVQAFETKNGHLPASAAEAGFTKLDPWGHAYTVAPKADGTGFTLKCEGFTFRDKTTAGSEFSYDSASKVFRCSNGQLLDMDNLEQAMKEFKK